MSEFTYDVFLSYNSEDKQAVRHLAQRMQKAGLNVWFDEWVISPGDDIFLAIERGLEGSRVLVLCMSAAAFGSDWVALERSTVLFRDPLNLERRFIPLILSDCNIPDTLRRYNHVDYRNENEAGWEKLLTASKGTCTGATPTPTPPPSQPQKHRSSLAVPTVIRVRCKLNCRDAYSNMLHLRPASYIVGLCAKFPRTEFRIIRHQRSPSEEVNPTSIADLTIACFEHGEDVTVEVTGKCRSMAAQFFKVAWENLDNYANDPVSNKARLTKLIDEAFGEIDEPDIEDFGSGISPEIEQTTSDDCCRSVATINDRLHNLSLPMIPLIARYFKCRTHVAFDDRDHGIYLFEMEAENGFALDTRIMNLVIEVGTRITVLTWGPNRFKANDSIKTVLEYLWECDAWLRERRLHLESDATIRDLIEYAHARRLEGSEFGYVQNPFLSNLLTPKHVFVNLAGSVFSKEEVLRQLAAPHVGLNGVELFSLLNTMRDLVIREGLALAHAAMENGPRISITFGVYPSGVVWSDSGQSISLVAMVVFAKDTYKTWLDFMRKMAIVFRQNPTLLEQLTWSRNSEEFLLKLRQAETSMIKQKT
ncbi:MAG: TIR domain-containing protein [Chthoniobacter sp.]|uniref:TIR domain-containing protein n=1 Tax=Chthoniobacter sp. TaxID=2510640 RepID=UPI0032ADBBFE